MKRSYFIIIFVLISALFLYSRPLKVQGAPTSNDLCFSNDTPDLIMEVSSNAITREANYYYEDIATYNWEFNILGNGAGILIPRFGAGSSGHWTDSQLALNLHDSSSEICKFYFFNYGRQEQTLKYTLNFTRKKIINSQVYCYYGSQQELAKILADISYSGGRHSEREICPDLVNGRSMDGPGVCSLTAECEVRITQGDPFWYAFTFEKDSCGNRLAKEFNNGLPVAEGFRYDDESKRKLIEVGSEWLESCLAKKQTSSKKEQTNCYDYLLITPGYAQCSNDPRCKIGKVELGGTGTGGSTRPGCGRGGGKPAPPPPLNRPPVPLAKIKIETEDDALAYAEENNLDWYCDQREDITCKDETDCTTGKFCKNGKCIEKTCENIFGKDNYVSCPSGSNSCCDKELQQCCGSTCCNKDKKPTNAPSTYMPQSCGGGFGVSSCMDNKAACEQSGGVFCDGTYKDLCCPGVHPDGTKVECGWTGSPKVVPFCGRKTDACPQGSQQCNEYKGVIQCCKNGEEQCVAIKGVNGCTKTPEACKQDEHFCTGVGSYSSSTLCCKKNEVCFPEKSGWPRCRLIRG